MIKKERFWWIKLFTDFFRSPQIDWLKEQENGCKYIVLYLELCCLTANNEGRLVREVGQMLIPYEAKKIAELTRFDIDTVIIGLALYQKCGLVFEEKSGVITITDMPNMVGSETDAARRKRAQRARIKEKQQEDNVPKMSQQNIGQLRDNVPTVSLNCPIDIDKNIDKDIETETDTEFSIFWDSYPKKYTKVKEETKLLYKALVGYGISPNDIIQAAQKYCREVRFKNIETKYIKMPNNFLSDAKYLEYVPTFQSDCQKCKGEGHIINLQDDGRMEVTICDCKNRFNKLKGSV